MCGAAVVHVVEQTVSAKLLKDLLHSLHDGSEVSGLRSNPQHMAETLPMTLEKFNDSLREDG